MNFSLSFPLRLLSTIRNNLVITLIRVLFINQITHTKKRDRFFFILFPKIAKGRQNAIRLYIRLGYGLKGYKCDLLLFFLSLSPKLINAEINAPLQIKFIVPANFETHFIQSFLDLYPFSPDISIQWEESDTSEIGSIPDKHIIQLSSDISVYSPSDFKFEQNLHSLNINHIPNLIPSLSFITFARSVFKQHYHGIKIIVCELNIYRYSEKEWFDFFGYFSNQRNRVHFYLLNDFSDPLHSLISAMSNVTATKIQGYSFLQECAIIRESDMFVGTFNEYGVILIGTEIPYIIETAQIPNELSHLVSLMQTHNDVLKQYWVDNIYPPLLLKKKISSVLFND